MSTCPPQQLWHDLGRTWMLALIDSLRNNIHGFNELREALGISNKVLSERLQILEEHKLVNKEAYTEENIERTRYTLTQKARDLYPLLDAYKNFVSKYDEKLLCGDIECTECPYIIEKK